MTVPCQRHTRQRISAASLRQRGFAMLTLLAIITVGLTYALVTGLNAWSMKLDRERRTDEALAQAKEALIAYATATAFIDPSNALNGLFGYLPCPEDTGALPEGSEQSSVICGTTAVSKGGRLPWRPLGLPAPTDGASECLWYVVSGRYKRTFVLPSALFPTGNPLMDADGILADGQIETFTPEGARLAGAPGNRVVAVIFAPGQAQGGQVHSNSSGHVVCPGNFTASNYLDVDTSGSPITDPDTGTALTINNSVVSGAVNGVTHLLAGPAPNRGINDRLIYVTRDEIYAAMIPLFKDLTRHVADCVRYFGTQNANYATGDRRLPWASRMDLSGGFGNRCSYNDRTDWLAGRMPDRVNNSAQGPPPNTAFSDVTCLEPGSDDQLLRQASPCPGWVTYFSLWDRWKSLFFYAIAPAYKPDASTPSSCGTCLQVNGSGQYAAIVLFGGPALSGQVRTDDSQRALPANYLEGANPNDIADSSGTNRNYKSGRAAPNFNDILYCVAPDLSVAPCPLP